MGLTVFVAFDVIGKLTFDKKLGFLSRGSDIDGIMEANDAIMVYSSVCGQAPGAHPFLLGNPLIPKLLPQMETWNPVLVFTLEAINRRTTMTRDGELELDGGRVGNDMLSRWAAVKSSDPLKMSLRDLVVQLTTNVCLPGLPPSVCELMHV